MRVLLWPTYSYPGNVDADSLYIIARNLIRANPELFWYLVVPYYWKPDIDELDGRPNVAVVVDEEMMPLYRTQEAVITEEIVWQHSPQAGIWPVEAVVSMSPARMLSIANAYGIRTGRTDDVVRVNWDLLVRDDHKGEIDADDAELLHQAAGTAAAHVNVYESPVARKMSHDIVRKYMSSAMVKRVLDSSVDVLQGVDVDRIYEATADVQKRKKFAVYYGGRLSTSKRFEELAYVVQKFYEFGRDVEFVVTTGSLEGTKHQKLKEEFPFIELHVGLSQEDAWSIMASCHTSLCFSSHELFGMSFWEQMCSGLPVVMKAETWNKDLLPDDYPWLATSKKEAAAYLRGQYEVWKMGKWPELVESESGSTHVMEHMDSKQNLHRFGQMIKANIVQMRMGALDSFEHGGRAGLSDLVDVVTQGRDEIHWVSLVEGIRDVSRIGHNVIGAKLKWARSNSMLDLYRMMIWKGWTDTHDDLEIRLIR